MTYLLKEMNDCLGRLLTKYETRGWRARDVLWPEDEASNGSILGYRRIGDGWTWIIPFDNTGVDHPETPDSVLEYSTYFLRKNPGGFLGCYLPRVVDCGSLLLKYRYACLKQDQYTYMDEIASDFWSAYAGPRLDRLSLIELFKIPRSSRSRPIQEAIDMSRFHRRLNTWDRLSDLLDLASELADSGLKLPSYDHEIPSWYAQWEKQQPSRTKPFVPTDL